MHRVFQSFLGLIKCSGQCVFCHRQSPSLCRNPILLFFIILEFLCVDSWVFKQRKIPVDNSEWHRHRNERTAGCNQMHHDQCGLKEYFCFIYNISCLQRRCKHFPDLYSFRPIIAILHRNAYTYPIMDNIQMLDKLI